MAEENLQIAIFEKQILHCLLEHNELLDKDYDISFISPQGLEFYLDLIKLRKQNKKIIAENILTLDNEYLTSDLVIAVQETEYSADEFDDYVEAVHCDKSFVITKEVFDELNDYINAGQDNIPTKKYEEFFKKINNASKDNGQEL